MGDLVEALRIVVINSLVPEGDEGDPARARAAVERARALRIGLLEGGYNIVAAFPPDAHLPERIAQLQPDLIIVDSESDARDTLEHVCVATRDDPRPIVLFTEDSDTRHVKRAIEAGVSAYVVAGLHPERIKPVLDVAMARFEVEQGLRTALSDTRAKLAERKTVERAKGILMTRHGCTEDEAYRRLRRLAMDRNLKLAELAQRLIDVADVLI